MPLLLAYLITVGVVFLLWYVHWHPTDVESTLPLWLWVMGIGGAVVLLQFFVFLTWNNWVGIVQRLRSYAQSITDPTDDVIAGEEDEEDFVDEETPFGAFSVTGVPVGASVPLSRSSRKFPSYSSLMQAGGIDASASTAYADISPEQMPVSAAEHRSGSKSIAKPLADAADIVEYVATPKHTNIRFAYSSSDDSMGASSPLATEIEDDIESATSPIAGAGFEPGSPTIDVFIDDRSLRPPSRKARISPSHSQSAL